MCRRGGQPEGIPEGQAAGGSEGAAGAQERYYQPYEQEFLNKGMHRVCAVALVPGLFLNKGMHRVCAVALVPGLLCTRGVQGDREV